MATLVAHAVGFVGNITTDTTKPDGTPQKLLDASRITALGWQPRTTLEAGLATAYADFCKKETLS